MHAYRISLGLALVFCWTALGEEPPRLFSTVVEGQVLNLEGAPIPEADVFAISVGTRDRSKIS
jgi:hypothetical protein